MTVRASPKQLDEELATDRRRRLLLPLYWQTFIMKFPCLWVLLQSVIHVCPQVRPVVAAAQSSATCLIASTYRVLTGAAPVNR